MSITMQPIQIDVEQVKELYDSLSAKIYADMDKQYKEKKISGATYATTWAALMQGVISGSLQAVVSLQTKETDADRCLKEAQCEEIAKKSAREECLAQAECKLKATQENEIKKESSRKDSLTSKELCIKTEQCNLTKKQVASEESKRQVLDRQRAGFDDNLRQKLFEAQMNAWALMYSSGILVKAPTIITDDAVSHLYAQMLP